MALSYNTYLADGANRNFPVEFAYLEPSHVKVYLDGVETTAFSWLNATTIQLDSAPGDGVAVRIQRETPSAPLVDFQDTGALLEKDLDTAFLQALYRAIEAVDQTDDALRLDRDDFQWDAEGKRLKNLAPPVEATDAATREWVENDVRSDLNAAVAEAQAAQAAAEAAESGAAAERVLAEAARAGAEAAEANAELAQAEAEAARDTAQAVAGLFPQVLTGQAGKLLQVNAAGTAYELLAQIGQAQIAAGAVGAAQLAATLNLSDKALTMPAGHVVQVVAATYGGPTVSTTSTSDVATGLSASITLKAASNKVLAIVCGSFQLSNQANAAIDNVFGWASIYRDGVRRSVESGSNGMQLVGQPRTSDGTLLGGFQQAVQALDAPGSVGPHTYEVRMRTGNNGRIIFAYGSIVLLEIAA